MNRPLPCMMAGLPPGDLQRTGGEKTMRSACAFPSLPCQAGKLVRSGNDVCDWHHRRRCIGSDIGCERRSHFHQGPWRSTTRCP